MTPKLRIGINILLVFLVVLDVVLATLAFFFPEFWFRTIHNAPEVDPQGLLQRTGAVWAAFTLFQLIALLKWQRQPYWLIIVAGIRLTEVFSDWTYLYFAQDITQLGRLGLFIAPPGNLLFSWFLIRSFLHIRDKT